MNLHEKGFSDILLMPRRALSRRALIGALGSGTLATVIAACGGATEAPTASPEAEATKPAASAATTAPKAEAAKPAAGGVPGAATTVVSVTGGATPIAADTAPEGGTLVIGFWREPDTLNPYLPKTTYPIWINQWVNAEMIKTGQDDKLIPWLLKEVPTLDNGGVSQDGKTYKITFKDGLKWADGQPLTADDLIFTWQMISEPKFGAASNVGWEQIQSIEASSDRLTATITLKEVYVPFIGDVFTFAASAGAGWLLPKHLLENVAPEKIAEDPYSVSGANGFTGAGPFKVAEWRKGVSLTLERNSNWHGDKPKLEKVIFSMVGTREQEMDDLRAGNLDYAVDFIEAQVPDLEKLPGAIVYPSKSAGSVERYYFNMREPGDLSRPHRIWGGADGAKVRLAMAMLMNRQAVVDTILFGATTVAINEMDNSVAWKTDGLQPYPYEPTKAEQMLDDLGWKKGTDGIREKDGVKFEFKHATTSGNVMRETIQRAFLADFEKAGIRMTIENHQPSEMFASYTENGLAATGKIDMWGWTSGSADPSIYFDLLNSAKIPSKEKPNGNNYIGYKNATMDDLTQRQNIAIDPKERKTLIDQIHRLLYDEVPILYVYNRLNVSVGKTNVVGVHPYPAAGFYWNVEQWGIAK